MNLEQLAVVEETTSMTHPETAWQVDAEPSNIISLAEQGLLNFDMTSRLAEEFSYNDYSPLNEW